ncbi:conserved hypothetical protein [Desulfosarcina cetonica]|uniref:helix-turn-helix domain-containing protein n=1 Tax=Desulfosarcina cetonica TaxID=90730 RepID=UPI0006D2C9F2|nr:helix-turn-helix domain-containing protein [Desulfosarcina cetonica]VTR66765.1 conserved hypothetical protein [Desulfosarcina cetonica]
MGKLLTEKQVAEKLSLHVQTLRNWRFHRRDLPYLKVGSAVRYDPDDVEKWLEHQKVNPA